MKRDWAATSGAPLNSRNSFTMTCIIYWPLRSPALSLSTSFLTGKVTASWIMSPEAKTVFSLLAPMGREGGRKHTRTPRTFLPSNRLSANSLYLYFPVLKENLLQSISTTYKVHWSRDAKLTWGCLGYRKKQTFSRGENCGPHSLKCVFLPQRYK